MVSLLRDIAHSWISKPSVNWTWWECAPWYGLCRIAKVMLSEIMYPNPLVIQDLYHGAAVQLFAHAKLLQVSLKCFCPLYIFIIFVDLKKTYFRQWYLFFLKLLYCFIFWGPSVVVRALVCHAEGPGSGSRWGRREQRHAVARGFQPPKQMGSDFLRRIQD